MNPPIEELAPTMQFCWNGLLVTTWDYRNSGFVAEKYRGLACGKPWPLSDVGMSSTNDDRRIVGAIKARTINRLYRASEFVPQVVPTVSLVADYVLACQANGLEVRVILCATPRSEPVMAQLDISALMPSTQHLGFDYAYSTCDFSAIGDDLASPVLPGLMRHLPRLNASGLFDTYDDLADYLDTRRRVIKEAGEHLEVQDQKAVLVTPLERNGDFTVFYTREIVASEFASRSVI